MNTSGETQKEAPQFGETPSSKALRTCEGPFCATNLSSRLLRTRHTCIIALRGLPSVHSQSCLGMPPLLISVKPMQTLVQTLTIWSWAPKGRIIFTSRCLRTLLALQTVKWPTESLRHPFIFGLARCQLTRPHRLTLPLCKLPLLCLYRSLL